MTIGVYPGTFDPLTVAHLAVADAAYAHLGLHRLDLAISRAALGKTHLDTSSIDGRVEAIVAATADRPWLAVVIVDSQLIVDVSHGYDVVVMGADKWAQILDPQWYGGDAVARDDAVARLPRVAVAPRVGHDVPAELLLAIPDGFEHVSATAVRAGRAEWAASWTSQEVTS